MSKHTAITLSDDDWHDVLVALAIYSLAREDEAIALIRTSIATQREAAAKGWNEQFGHVAEGYYKALDEGAAQAKSHPAYAEMGRELEEENFTLHPIGTTTVQTGDQWRGLTGWLPWPPYSIGHSNGIELRRPIKP